MDSAIGIMGGTFNPFHNGHLQLAKMAHEQIGLPKILVMPSGVPAHKSRTGLISAEHRCNMTLAAIQEYPYMELSTMEVTRTGNTYTSDTLQELKAQNPTQCIYFIIGADSLFDLPKWHEPEYVMTHCILLAANRDEHAKEELLRQKAFLEENYHAQIQFLQTPMLPYSSTDIRQNIKLGKSIDEMVPKAVFEYIENHQLYRN